MIDSDQTVCYPAERLLLCAWACSDASSSSLQTALGEQMAKAYRITLMHVGIFEIA